MFVALHPHVKFYLTLFILILTNNLFAQDKIGVLKKQLSATKTEANKIKIYYDLGEEYKEKNIDSSLYYFDLSLSLAQKTHNQLGLSTTMLGLARAHLYHSKNEDEALKWLNECIRTAQPIKDYENLSQCYFLLGIIAIHQHTGNTFELYNTALYYAKKTNNWRSIYNCYSVMVDYFISKGDFSKGEELSLKALHLSKSHDADYWMSQGLDYCDILEKQGKFKQSLAFAKILNQSKHTLKMTKGYFVYMNDMGRLETKLKNYTKSENILLKILNYEQQKSKIDTFHLYFIFRHLESLYLAKNDFKKAYNVSKEFNQASLWLSQKRQTQNSQVQMTRLKAASDLEKKEAQISLLAEKQKEQLLFLVAATMVAILMVVFVIILQRNKKKIEQQKAELSQLNLTKDRLFSIIAHDLRGPITSFKGILNLFNDDSLTQHEFIGLSKSLNQSVDNIHAMLENLLLWSLSQMNGIKPFERELYVIDLVEESVTLVKEIAHRKEIDLLIDIPENLKILADENNIRAILRNLLNNALKFTPQHGKVSILANLQGQFTEITISDTGIGMKPEELSTIFSTPTLKQGTAGEKGTGLGLVLCKELIEQNGGKISVSSQYQQGTTFVIILPTSPKKSV